MASKAGNRSWRGVFMAVFFAAFMATLPGAAVAAGDGPSPAPSRGREPRAGAVALRSAPDQKVTLTLPFVGAWGVIQGFDSAETHVGYAAYALDFVPAEKLATALPMAKRRRLADFPCFGRPVLSPADGRVVAARDRSPDRPPGKEVKRDTGNYIILEHAAGEYTELRHLKARSILVQVGDAVVRGQEVASCGNSGNASTPHLHIGLLGSADPIATRPMRFSNYQVLQADGSWRPGDGVPLVGQIVRTVEAPPSAPVPLRQERPTR